MAYLGVSPSNGVRKVHTYTATASQTTFSGAGAENISLSYRDSTYIDVYQNGVKLADADYTATSGTSVVLDTGASADDMVVVVVYDVFSVADTVSKTDGGQFDGNVTMAGTLAVTGTTALTGNATFSGDIIKSTSGNNNFAAGVNAGNSIASGGNDNTCVGDEAGTAITTGDNSVVIGYRAGDAMTTGSSNIAIGRDALGAETTGNKNVAIGTGALETQNFTGGTDSLNVAVGNNAGVSLTTGEQNVFIGANAGDACTDDDHNTFVGYDAGSLVNGGFRNTFIGKGSGDDMTTGDKNVILGSYGGNGGGGSLDIRTNTNNVALSDGDGVVRFYSDESSYSAIGIAGQNMLLVQGNRIAGTTLAGGTVDNAMSNGASNRRWTEVFAVSSTINTSDENEKQDIEALSEKEKKVAVSCKGLIKKYRWKDAVAKKGNDARIHVGVIAQELKSAFEAEGLDASRYGMFCLDTWWEKEITVDAVKADKEKGVEAKDAYTYTDTKDEATEGYTEKTRLGVRYSELLAFIISAI